MSNKHVIESVLRPAVELNSAIVAFCAGAVCLYAPWSLALTPSIGYGMCGAFWLFSFFDLNKDGAFSNFVEISDDCLITP